MVSSSWRSWASFRTLQIILSILPHISQPSRFCASVAGAAPHARVVVPVPAGHIPDRVPGALHSLGLQDLNKAGDAVALYLFQGA